MCGSLRHFLSLPHLLLGMITWSLVAASLNGQESTVDFQRDVQPIFAEHCARCHGVDEETREGGLRLDLEASLLAGGDSGEPAVVPGKPDQSYLMARITSSDESEIMPPPDEKKPLSEQQIATLQKWIEAGAPFQTHWAFVRPERPAMASTDSHPIDTLVDATLSQKQMERSPAAPNYILCRRLYLDLIGLPPSPEQWQAFQTDGLRATVDKLLASPRFGEKWARHWLDVARYSDTNGYEKDLRREQWAWRDWVVTALNEDKPYNQFVIEQIAGDLLPNATQDNLIATGFLRNSMINEEGAIVPEQFRMVEMFDRMDCVGKAVLGLTTQCAQCHSHKFDPLTHEEYFGMFAYLNNSYEARSWVYNQDQQQKRDDVFRQIQTLEDKIKQACPDWQTQVNQFAVQQALHNAAWTAVRMHDMNSISGLNHPVHTADDSILMLGHTSSDVYLIGKTELEAVTGVRLEVLTHGDLPHLGPGRNDQGTWDIQELEVLTRHPQEDGSWSDWQKQELTNATADWSQPEQKHDEGKKTSGSVLLLIDGTDNSWWAADRGIGRRNQPSVAVVQFAKPLTLPAGAEWKFVMRMGQMVGCCRISLTDTEAPCAQPVDYAAVLAAAVDADSQTLEQQHALFDAWRKTLPADQAKSSEIAALFAQLLPAMTSILHVQERAADDPRATHVLDRGQWDSPARTVQPHVPAALHPLPESDEPDRLRFARWLVAEESPLAARVAVNRIWQAMFGEGLVATPEDFGTRAPTPEHLPLLNYLAVEFMKSGWSQKQLIRQIVTSQTYAQDSHASPDAYAQDPANRWLARGPRFRAEAEVVRDIALSVSGLIHHKLGGPSVIPPVPQNVLNYNYTYPGYWKPAEGPDRYRRTLYGFRKRSMPDPVMSNFDAPNGDMACARRILSNTPLAALTGLNETIFVEAARAFALRILRDSEPDDAKRIELAFQLCVCRQPTSAEVDEVLRLLQTQRKRLADGWLDERMIATGQADQLPDLPAEVSPQDAAAWTLVSRVLLNLDETISKN